MTKPNSPASEPPLKDLVWSLLMPTQEPDTCLMPDELIFEIYQRGIIDSRRYRFDQWKAVFKDIPNKEEVYFVNKSHWPRLSSFFFQGPIKKPFDPKKLKDGPRPLSWLNEVYQKVLRFETSITFDNWRRIVSQHIQPRFVKNDQVFLRQEIRDLLAKILLDKASSLRKLELWYHGQGPSFTVDEPKKEEKKFNPAPISDSFLSKPAEGTNKAAIDKLYYHHEQHPGMDDKESLDFLDELAKLGDEEAEIK